MGDNRDEWCIDYRVLSSHTSFAMSGDGNAGTQES